MKRLVCATFVISALAAPAFAASPGQAPAVSAELVLMPQSLVEATRNFIRHPTTDGAVDLWVSLTQCEAANAPTPSPGAVEGCRDVATAVAQYRARMASAPASPDAKPVDTPAATVKPPEK